MQPHPSEFPTSLWTENLKFKAKINFPVLKGKPRMNKNQEQFTKAEIDYLKDKLSSIIQFHEWSMKERKVRAERWKKAKHEVESKAEFNTIGKMQKELKKLAELQRKIKRMR